MDAELEKEEMEIPDMDPEVNVDLPVVDMEGQEVPPNIVEIDDPDIPQDPNIIAPEYLDDPDGRTQVSTPAKEGPRRSTIVSSQPEIYAPIMTVKRYEYAMTQIECKGLLDPNAQFFSQKDFTKPKMTL